MTIPVDSIEETMTDDLLKFDSLDTAEKMTGKSYKDDADTAKLGFALHMQKNELTRRILTSQDDMTFGGTLATYLRLLNDLGFEKVFEEKFVDREKEIKSEETYYIFWHPIKAILCTFDTYWKQKSLNSAKWYFSFKPNDPENFWSKFSLSGHFWIPGGWQQNPPKDQPEDKSKWIWVGYWDAREAIRHQMKKFDDNGFFANPWPESQHLQLNHYMDWDKCRQGDYSHAAIETERRFNLLPEKIKKSLVGHGHN